jgi:hypothetical protein
MADRSRTSGSSRVKSRDEKGAIAGLVTVDGGYPGEAPFHPDERFPEYGSRSIAQTPNPVYRAVRDLFYRLGFDVPRYGTSAWNPLGHIVRPGDRVFIVPWPTTPPLPWTVAGKS